MENNRDSITPNQLMTFIVSCQIGIGILTLPAKLAEKAGHNGWISVIISTFICFILITIIVLLLKRYDSKSIIQINSLLYGKYIGNLINCYFIFYLLLTSTLLIRSLTDIIQIMILSYTPVLIICFVSITTTFYLSNFGLKSICRYAIIIYFVIAITIILCFVVSGHFKLTFLMPVGEGGLYKIVSSLKVSALSFIGFELVSIVYPYVTDKNKVLKKTLGANLITGLHYLLVVSSCTALYGENFLKRLEYPLFNMSRIYQAPIFERLDLFYVTLWLPAMAGTTMMYFYCTQLAIRDLFKIKPKMIYIIIHIILLIFLSRIPRNTFDLEKYFNYLNITAVSIMVLFILSCFFSFINKRGVRKK